MKLVKFKMLLCTTLLVITAVNADDTEGPSISGGITAVGQVVADDKVNNETAASADVVGVVPLGMGSVNIHLEGSTTLGRSGVAALIGEANGDAGSAMDADGHGRVQLSELFYAFTLGGSAVDIGMLDPAANIDNNAVANDENTQFLASPLINNPTIEFPDYTLGLSLGMEPETTGFGYHLFVGSSHGLGNNTHSEYYELVDIGAKHKGVFTAAEGVWKTPALTSRLGMWYSSNDHQKLGAEADSEDYTDHNYGVYGNLNGALGAGSWGLRAGWADPSVSWAVWSISAALEYPVYEATTAGIGLAHTAASDKLGVGFDDNLVAEAYVRYELGAHLQLTPAVQYIKNPSFDSSGDTLDQEQWLASLRLHVPF